MITTLLTILVYNIYSKPSVKRVKIKTEKVDTDNVASDNDVEQYCYCYIYTFTFCYLDYL